MHKDVRAAVKRLGGKMTTSTKQSLLKSLLSIKIPNAIFPYDWQDNKDIEDDLIYFCSQQNDSYKSNRKAFLKELKIFAESISKGSQQNWFAKHYKPFEPDHPGGPMPVSSVKNVIKKFGKQENDMFEFIQIPYGYHDSAYLCLQDSILDNPTLITAEETGFFSAVQTSNTTLSEYLNSFITLDMLTSDLEKQCAEIYENETNSDSGKDESDTEGVAMDEEYEDIEINEDDIENLFVEVDNALNEIKNLSEKQRKSTSTHIIKVVCELLDDSVGTELYTQVNKIAKQYYKK